MAWEASLTVTWELLILSVLEVEERVPLVFDFVEVVSLVLVMLVVEVVSLVVVMLVVEVVSLVVVIVIVVSQLGHELHDEQLHVFLGRFLEVEG